ncbi:hypothetical protein KZW03_31045, partial [Klebsiella pneumoniae]
MNTGHHDPLHPDAFGAAATTVPPAPASAPGERDDALPQDAAHDSPPQDLSPLPAPAQDAAALTALLIGLIAGPKVIRMLTSLKIGQPIRGYAMQTHLSKSG